ncbi:TPA: helix-turn-helix transcriptional regulator [Acinetobacter baumannii]|uniref:helix-turn-helix transcriptional regulator n=1 Tax=Acinetobacter baumannii TaxID=470 RepID=UPI00355C73A2
MSIQPLRITFNETCTLLGLSRSGLEQLIKKDSTFPTPIKLGKTRQAAVFFDYADLLEWHNTTKRQAA